MANAASNKLKYLVVNKEIDFGADTFKIILMQSGFSFSPTYDTYADVSASELANGLGYTTGGNTLAGVSVTEDDTNHLAYITWNNSAWTANGGDLVASGAVIYDDTVSSPADPIVGYIDFGGDKTILDGGTGTVANIRINLA